MPLLAVSKQIDLSRIIKTLVLISRTKNNKDEALQQIRAYNVKHNYNVSNFLEDYRRLLQRAVDEIWNNIVWINKTNKSGRNRYSNNS
jgi:hypothetical protein